MAAAASPLRAGSTPGSAPLNDDEGERLRHRAAIVNNRRQMKKTLLSPALKTAAKVNPPTVAATAAALRPRNSPLASTMLQKAIPPPSTAAPQAAPKLTAEQRNRMFEEWMKIAADNKINAKNSWNVALIDYFSELTFLREGDSINFQKASCTLDGCVKIYASRVDSVADETGKLLNGLADGPGRRGGSRWGDDIADGPGDDGTLDQLGAGQEGGGGRKGTKSSKRPHRQVDTLEASFEALDVKNFQLEFALDPLFRKTCAEFDESGTRGCLTGNLPLSPSGRLMLDNSEDFAVDGDSSAIGQEAAAAAESLGQLNLASLWLEHGRELTSLTDRVLLPSLADFSFLHNAGDYKPSRQMSEVLERLANLPPVATTMAIDGVSEDDDDDDGEEDAAAAAAAIVDNQVVGVGHHFDTPLDELVPFNDDYDQFGPEDLVSPLQIPANPIIETAMGEETTMGFEPSGMSSSFLAYFDSKLQRNNWAGPEHWKIQRPHFKRLPTTPLGTEKPRAAKKEFSLDFYAPSVDIASIFVKANPATITLSRSALDERNAKDNLLPEDLHFSSAELLRLFTNPSWVIGRKRRAVSATTRSMRAPAEPLQTTPLEPRPDLEPEEVEASYWADPQNLDLGAAIPDAAGKDEHVPAFGDLDDQYDYPAEPPLPEMMGMPGLPAAEEGTTTGLVATFRPTTTIPALDYARRAKKVDVQELKRALWAELEQDLAVPSPKGGQGGTSGPTTFSSLVRGLESSTLPKEMLSEVSVPYCFICLLHLANEHNLELREAPERSDLLVLSTAAPLLVSQ